MDDMMNTPVLPDFTRHQWASTVERQWWKTIIHDISNAWMELERLSVAEGLRPAAWQIVTPGGLIEATYWAAQHGLIVVPTNTIGTTSDYSSTSPSGTDNIRIVYTKPEHYQEVHPWTNNEKIGRLLGFPECCRRHFEGTWGLGSVDNTYEQVSLNRTHCHTLLRWMGVRLVPHLPCRFDCEPSATIAEQFAELGNRHGFKEEILAASEILNWPVKASRLFGISELVFPALKITTRSDWTPIKEVFEYPGTYYKPTADLWTDNGYSDPGVMRTAHKTLINSLTAELPQNARVVDLGCGNGLLVRRLTINRPDVRIAGCDTNSAAIQHAPMLVGKWWNDSIENGAWADWKPTAALISIERFLAMDPVDRDRILGLLAGGQTFIYCYADGLKSETLEQLTVRAGLPTLRMLQQTPSVSVGLLTRS